MEMKIVRQTPNLLMLRCRPVLSWILGLVFASVGLVIMLSGNAITITCNRTEPTVGSCKLLESNLTTSQEKVIPLSILRGAKVKEDDSGESSTYQIIILTSHGDIPLSPYPNSDKAEAIASHINQFLITPKETSLTQHEDERLHSFLFGGSFFIVSLVILTVPFVTCVFDKSLNTLIIKRRDILGTKVIEHGFREIKDVLVEESTDSEGSTYRVIIVLVSGDRLPLTSHYSSGGESKQETVSCIKSFLNIEN